MKFLARCIKYKQISRGSCLKFLFVRDKNKNVNFVESSGMFVISKHNQSILWKFCFRQVHMASSIPLNFLGGKRVPASNNSKSIKKINAASGAFMFDIKCSGQEDVNIAVNNARNAFNSWSRKTFRERGQILTAAAFKIREKLEDIAQAEVTDTGKPIWEARVDIAGCADVLEYYGGIAPSIHGDHHTLSDGSFAMIQREPLGVVAGIGAWNYPFQVMSWKVAPALACGNTFVYKPSECTPITSVILAEIFSEVGLPPDVVNIVQGGHETGELLCKHPAVAKVTFTGSVNTGQKIMKTCADTMKRVTMELGGKSALIVFSDCDLKNAVKATLLGNFLTQGEVCTNCTRVYVQKGIFETFTKELVNAAEKLKVGNPFDEDCLVGAIINADHGNKILKYINTAIIEGATIAFGGKKIEFEDPALGGTYISPCVITNCTDNMTIVKEEIFGPVVSIMQFDCEDEAISRANATPYGLAAGVMTKDLQRAHRVASSLQAGIVWINNYNIFPPELPFGGYKMSGFGRENGLAAINDFTQLKTVYVEMNKDIDCPLYKE